MIMIKTRHGHMWALKVSDVSAVDVADGFTWIHVQRPHPKQGAWSVHAMIDQEGNRHDRPTLETVVEIVNARTYHPYTKALAPLEALTACWLAQDTLKS